MDQIRMVIATRWGMSDHEYARLGEVDHRLLIEDISNMMTVIMGGPGQPPSQETSKRQVAYLGLKQPLSKAEIMYGMSPLPSNFQALAPGLKWLHLAGTGIDHLGLPPVDQLPFVVTNSRGALGVPIAEWITTVMLMLAKDVPTLLNQQRQKLWQRYVTQDLSGKTIAIIGLGAIGSALAKLAQAFEMRVLATRLSARHHERDVNGVHELYPASQLHNLLRQADFVALTLPLTAETYHLIGSQELAILKPTAYIINVGRGAVIEQNALVKALHERCIAGVALDVVDQEPLDPDNALWKLPNVIISPHMAGSTESHSKRVADIFVENLRRYLAGTPLLNILSPKSHY